MGSGGPAATGGGEGVYGEAGSRGGEGQRVLGGKPETHYMVLHVGTGRYMVLHVGTGTSTVCL